MKRPFGLLLLGLGLMASSALAQPDQPKAPPPSVPQPAAPPAVPGEAKPQMPPGQPGQAPPLTDPQQGLPPGHPPINAPQRPSSPATDPQMMERLRQLRQRAQEQAERAGTGVAPKEEQRFPRDEHGHCIGQGPNDRPADINLMHGWLLVNNEKAVPPPRPKGSWEWWQWRLTPYPWRYENHKDHCDPRNQPVPLIANVVNLGVLIFLLVRFGKKPMREALQRRKGRIMSEIDRAREIKKSAKARLTRYEDELDHLDEKLAELRLQYAAEGANEERRLGKELDETRGRMLADADFRIAQESKQARDDLSHEALEEALASAEKLLEGTVTPGDHERLCEEYLEQIGAALRSKPVVGPGGAE